MKHKTICQYYLELLDDLQDVVNDLVHGKAAGYHVAGGAAVVHYNHSLPGDALLDIEDAKLLGDLARPIGQQGDLAVVRHASISPGGQNKNRG